MKFNKNDDLNNVFSIIQNFGPIYEYYILKNIIFKREKLLKNWF